MYSLLSSQGVVLATVMAVSGTVILLALRRQKAIPTTQFTQDQNSKAKSHGLRSCISSDNKRREKMKQKKKKKVRFADDVIESSIDDKEPRIKDFQALESRHISTPGE